MADEFKPEELKQYLSGPSVAQSWDRVGSALAADDQSAIDSSLVEARLHELFQLSAPPRNRAALEQRVGEVSNAVNKQLRHARLGSNAEAVRTGLSKLNGAGATNAPEMTSVWQRYFSTLNKHEAETVERVTKQVFAAVGAVGAVESHDLTRRLNGLGLSGPGQQQVADALVKQGVRVVQAPPADVMAKIDGAPARSIMALIRPRAWADDETLTYSAFDAQPKGQKPLGVQDLEDAVSFFDSRNQQANKDAAIKLRSLYSTDEQLRDGVLAHHLAKVNEARLASFPEPVVDQFVHNGLDPDEGKRLLGQGAGSTATAQATKPVPEKPKKNDSEELAFKQVESLMDRLKLFEADQRLSRIRGWEHTESQLGQRVVQELGRRKAAVDQALTDGYAALNAGDVPAALSYLEFAEQRATDVPRIAELRTTLDTVSKDEQVVDRELQRLGLIHTPPGVDPTQTSKLAPTKFYFYVFGPTMLVDFLASARVGLDFYGFGGFITYVLLVSLTLGVFTLFAKRGVRHGKKGNVVAALIAALFLMGLMGWFTLAAFIFYAATFSKRTKSKEASFNEAQYESFHKSAKEHFGEVGLGDNPGGIVRYQGGGVGTRILPSVGERTVSINPPLKLMNQVDITPEPGDLLMFDRHLDLRSMIRHDAVPPQLGAAPRKELN